MTTHPTRASTGTSADLDAARLLLTRMGLSPADLLTTPQDRQPAPTFAEYIPIVSAAVTDGTRRVYGSYWNRTRRSVSTPSPICSSTPARPCPARTVAAHP
jgi:hypothetical protein